MGSVPPCPECGGIGRHKTECSSLTLEEKLLQRYGRDVPDGLDVYIQPDVVDCERS